MVDIQADRQANRQTDRKAAKRTKTFKGDLRLREKENRTYETA